MPTLKLVHLKTPCNACLISQGIVEEVIKKVQKTKKFAYVDIALENRCDLDHVKGLKIKKLPAILIDNKQITAGTIPAVKELEEALDKQSML